MRHTNPQMPLISSEGRAQHRVKALVVADKVWESWRSSIADGRVLCPLPLLPLPLDAAQELVSPRGPRICPSIAEFASIRLRSVGNKWQWWVRACD